MSRELTRIRELAALEDGWLDGEGRAPTAEAIASARTLAQALKLDIYSIFPRRCGGIQFEAGAENAVEFRVEASGEITTEIL